MTCGKGRINKYYMLIRRFVNATFRLLLKHDWDPKACETVNGILGDKGGPLWYDIPVMRYTSYHQLTMVRTAQTTKKYLRACLITWQISILKS